MVLKESIGFSIGTLAGAVASTYQWALGRKFPWKLERGSLDEDVSAAL